MHDALRVTLATLQTGMWLAMERLGEKVRPWNDTPRSIARLTPAWLTSVLQTDFPGIRVAAAEPVDQHRGTTDRARFALSYRDAGRGNPPPPRIFCKLAPVSLGTRLFVNLMRLGTTEIRCYQEVLPEAPIETPRCYHSSTAGLAQRFALIMEDLTEREVRFADVSSRLAADDARLVVDQLARLHARFWESPRLRTDLAWLKSYAHNEIWPLERFVSAIGIRQGLRRFPELVPEELHETAGQIIAGRDRLESAWACGPQTIIHGDAHVGNMYFPRNTVGFLDWQCVQRGQGMRDVTYFLINSVPTEVRREHQGALIEHYLASLAEQGVAGPSPDKAWEQYRLHAFYPWISSVFTAAMSNLQAAPIARAGVARSSAALIELDSLAALKTLTP
jgi:hypothetical protein